MLFCYRLFIVGSDQTRGHHVGGHTYHNAYHNSYHNSYHNAYRDYCAPFRV